jgi:hypothetical protein
MKVAQQTSRFIIASMARPSHRHRTRALVADGWRGTRCSGGGVGAHLVDNLLHPSGTSLARRHDKDVVGVRLEIQGLAATLLSVKLG